MVRFLQQNELGWGDYTKERRQWLGKKSLNEIKAEILQLKQNPNNPLHIRTSDKC